MAERLVWPSGWLTTPVAETLRRAGRCLLLVALPVAMTTPRIEVSAIHFTLSDALGMLGGTCWLVSSLIRPRRRPWLIGGKWPLLVLAAGSLSLISSPDPRATMLGVAELGALWLLPAIAVPNLFDSSGARQQLLGSIGLGSVLAAVANLWTATQVGFADGIPQVWGPADYYQGYFQVLGLSVAVPRLVGAITERHFRAGVLWTAAAILNCGALLIAQTRGAWLAAAAAMLTLVLLLRQVVRERAQSIFSLQANLTGFDSSIIRIALALSAWRMFLAHPVVGVGLKAFPAVLPNYAPPGLPDAVEMGPNHILTPIEGPHSTYLRLLSETGLLGAVALVGWELQGVLCLYRQYRTTPARGSGSRTNVLTLIASVVVLVIYNFFSEMNATGALPLVCVLALSCRAPEPERA